MKKIYQIALNYGISLIEAFLLCLFIGLPTGTFDFNALLINAITLTQTLIITIKMFITGKKEADIKDPFKD